MEYGMYLVHLLEDNYVTMPTFGGYPITHLLSSTHFQL